MLFLITYKLVVAASFPSDLSSSLTSSSCHLFVLSPRSPRTHAFPVQCLCGCKFTPITLLVWVTVLLPDHDGRDGFLLNAIFPVPMKEQTDGNSLEFMRWNNTSNGQPSSDYYVPNSASESLQSSDTGSNVPGARAHKQHSWTALGAVTPGS